MVLGIKGHQNLLTTVSLKNNHAKFEVVQNGENFDSLHSETNNIEILNYQVEVLDDRILLKGHAENNSTYLIYIGDAVGFGVARSHAKKSVISL